MTAPAQSGERSRARWDGRKAWLRMGTYWSLGAFVGYVAGYLPLERPKDEASLAPRQAVALALVLLAQPRILSRYGPFGRSRDWAAMSTFALLNGVFETMTNLAVYDAGRAFAKSALGLSSSAAVAAFGFLLFCVYSGLIHALFWVPHVLPRHELPNTPPFHSSALPSLILLTFAMLWLYESTGDVFSVCALHILVDAMLAEKICLTFPA